MRPTPHTGHCVTGLPPIVSTVAAHNAMSVSRHTPMRAPPSPCPDGTPTPGTHPVGWTPACPGAATVHPRGGWIEPGMGAIDRPLIAAHPLRPVPQHHAHLPKPIECAAGTGQPGTGQIHIRQRARPVERHTLHPGARQVHIAQCRMINIRVAQVGAAHIRVRDLRMGQIHARRPHATQTAVPDDGAGQIGTHQVRIMRIHPVEPGFREVRAVEVRATHPHPIPFGPCQVTELQWDRPQIAVDPNPFHQIRAYR